jgi:pimeloyl-ACP methyl ester carboxylesterase
LGFVLALSLVLVSVACGSKTESPPSGSSEVTIDTADGEHLDAVVVGQGSDVVILSHGATGTKEGFFAAADAFAADGWRAIAYDARGVGESTGGPRNEQRDTDLRAVVDYARSTGAKTIVLVGGSLGASLSLGMARELEADAVVALSPPAASFDAVGAAGDLRGEVPMFVAASEDNEPFADEARQVAEAAGVDAVIVSGEGHGSGVFDEHPEVIDQVIAWVDDTLGHGEKVTA